MNVYQLFTRSGACYFVLSHTSDFAVSKIEKLSGEFVYNACVNGVDFKIRTTDGALPPTCRLVEQDVEIPAEPAKPSRIEKRMVVECAKQPEETVLK